jgi:DNA repair protein RecN (Recombination protein N)
MLIDLEIENLALFERAEVRFGAGLNAITGETGAGKSLLLDALELLMGDKPRGTLVRKGADEARVEGRFALSRRGAESLSSFLDEHLEDLAAAWRAAPADDERELILSRTISASGRARAWINHRPATAKVLRELAARLVEIHGQNEHQRLMDAGEQVELLDAHGGLAKEVSAWRAARAEWAGLVARAKDHEKAARERADRLDLLRFQVRELSELRPVAEDHAELLQERERLRNAGELGAQLGEVAQALSSEEGGALDGLRRALRTLERWETRLADLAPVAEEVRQALVHAEEASVAAERYLARTEAAPERLQKVEDRLYDYESLSRKHRCDAAGLQALASRLAADLAAVEGGDASLEELLRRRDAAKRVLLAAGEALGAARRKAATRLQKEVKKHLADLGLARAEFSVRIEPRAAAPIDSPNAADEAGELRRLAPDGPDLVEFQLAANPGEPLQPLRLVASGGEAARIMLALRTALAAQQTIPTLVFDEIDSGVGGRLGPKVGEHLRALAATHQVVCVTHLPAIAAMAHEHLKVKKEVRGARTRTMVAALKGEERVEEIADMIAGGAAHATARAEAQRLLASI